MHLIEERCEPYRKSEGSILKEKNVRKATPVNAHSAISIWVQRGPSILDL